MKLMKKVKEFLVVFHILVAYPFCSPVNDDSAPFALCLIPVFYTSNHLIHISAPLYLHAPISPKVISSTRNQTMPYNPFSDCYILLRIPSMCSFALISSYLTCSNHPHVQKSLYTLVTISISRKTQHDFCSGLFVANAMANRDACVFCYSIMEGYAMFGKCSLLNYFIYDSHEDSSYFVD